MFLRTDSERTCTKVFLTFDQKNKYILEWKKLKADGSRITQAEFCMIRRLSRNSFKTWLREATTIAFYASRWYRKFGRRVYRPWGKYKDAEDEVFKDYQKGLSEGHHMPPDFIKNAMNRHMAILHQDKKGFKASDTWLHGRKSTGKKKDGSGTGKRSISLGWKHRYGVAFRVPTKKSSIPLEEKIQKLKPHHRWLVYRMAKPDPGYTGPVHPRYGMYEENQRFAADQVPKEFRATFKRTGAPRGAKMVAGKIAHKQMEKRCATNFIFVCAAKDRMPPPFLVLEGVPTQRQDGSYDTKNPVDHNKKVEAKRYADMGVNVYWDPKFRTSHWVLVDAFQDFKDWLVSIGETREVVIQLDNLHEHKTNELIEFLGTLQIRPLFLPSQCTDVGSVVDYDIGKAEKERMKLLFGATFAGIPTFSSAVQDKEG